MQSNKNSSNNLKFNNINILSPMGLIIENIWLKDIFPDSGKAGTDEKDFIRHNMQYKNII